MRRISYLWSDEKRGFWAAPEVVARDQLRGKRQHVIGGIGAELRVAAGQPFEEYADIGREKGTAPVLMDRFCLLGTLRPLTETIVAAVSGKCDDM